MYVSAKCNLGSDYHSWASWPGNMPAMVTLRRMLFLGQMVDSLNWSGMANPG